MTVKIEIKFFLIVMHVSVLILMGHKEQLQPQVIVVIFYVLEIHLKHAVVHGRIKFTLQTIWDVMQMRQAEI